MSDPARDDRRGFVVEVRPPTGQGGAFALLIAREAWRRGGKALGRTLWGSDVPDQATAKAAGRAEDVGDLERAAHAASTVRRSLHQRHQPVERAGHRPDRPGGDLGVEPGLCRARCARAAPGSRGCRRPARAGGWRSCAAPCAGRRACGCPPPRPVRGPRGGAAGSRSGRCSCAREQPPARQQDAAPLALAPPKRSAQGI